MRDQVFAHFASADDVNVNVLRTAYDVLQQHVTATSSSSKSKSTSKGARVQRPTSLPSSVTGEAPEEEEEEEEEEDVPPPPTPTSYGRA